MASIVNGLFSARSGISSHGSAIAVVGDNISNASTYGYKASRAEFEDVIAGGQASGRVIGAGSEIAAVNPIFQQGTLEFTGRSLDLAVDGNGFFVLNNNGQQLYTRAGNFKTDSSGFLISQDGFQLMGFPSGGSGSLEPLSINTVSQTGVATNNIDISGNLDASAPATISSAAILGTASTLTPQTTYADLAGQAEFSTVVDVFNSLGAKKTLTYFFFHVNDAPNRYEVRAYANSTDVDTAPVSAANKGKPRQVGAFTMNFDSSGQRSTPAAPVAGANDQTLTIAWNDGSAASSIGVAYTPFTQYAAQSNILSITQDGKGIGTVGSVSIEKNGDIFALLDNGQSSVIGRVGMVNFSNAEGLVRVGKNLLQQSPSSGEPVVGQPQSGTFGAIQSGSLELSTVDIANEFVKLITLQRGFQANSRIITTINQLLQEVIQLA